MQKRKDERNDKIILSEAALNKLKENKTKNEKEMRNKANQILEKEKQEDKKKRIKDDEFRIKNEIKKELSNLKKQDQLDNLIQGKFLKHKYNKQIMDKYKKRPSTVEKTYQNHNSFLLNHLSFLGV